MLAQERLAREATNRCVVVSARADGWRCVLLRTLGGGYLRCRAGGGAELEVAPAEAAGSDECMFEAATSGGFRHVLTGNVVAALPEGAKQERGPDRLPSELLADLAGEGLVCIPGLLAPAICAELLRLARATAQNLEVARLSPVHQIDHETPLVLRSKVAMNALANPVALWIIRNYLRCGFKFAHSPGFAILQPGQGTTEEDSTQDWHADYPYHGRAMGEYSTTFGSFPTELPFGLQFNTCVTEFSPENGSTCFALNSALLCRPPNEAWNTPHPYAGPEAVQLRAPQGSVILYDARTHHRNGINATDQHRVAILCSCIPTFIVDRRAHADVYDALAADKGGLWSQLTEREQGEAGRLMAGKL